MILPLEISVSLLVVKLMALVDLEFLIFFFPENILLTLFFFL